MHISKLQNFIVLLLVLFLGIFSGYYFGVRGYEVNLKKDTPIIDVKNKNGFVNLGVDIKNKNQEIPSSVDFSKFWVVWDDVTQKHVRKPINPEKLLDGAIHGMVNAVGDPYTSYFNIEENAETKNALNGKYEGIGAQLGFDENKNLIIQSPLEGSPAIQAGILAGDRILAINGEDTTGMSMTAAVDKIRGEAGTTVTLTIFRSSLKEPKDVPIRRDTIKIDSVTWEDKGDGIAYIKLSRFGETTNQEWTKAITEITNLMPNLNSIVLDVRNNPGGYLESAVYIASEFVPRGIVVREEFSDGTSSEYKVNRQGLLTDSKYKIIVLMNEGSASAAEIVAGALKERRDAEVIGMRSFGKGSVQKAEEYEDGTSLHVTIAKWLTPDGNWIDKYNSEFGDSKYNETVDGKEIKGGIKPDVVVKFTDEDIQNEKDVQLDKALEILKSK